MKKHIFFLLFIIVLLFGCSQEDNSVSLSYKAISIKWGKVSRGDYIAYAYDDGSYEIKSASNQKVAKGTYSYYTDDMDRITIKICETEYLDLDNNTMKSMSSIFSVAMNNNIAVQLARQTVK